MYSSDSASIGFGPCNMLCGVMVILVCLAASVLCADDSAGGADTKTSPYAKWEKGPSTAADYFPIGVSTQDPRFAQKFKDAGINMFLRLWAGPTDDQLDKLRKCGMQTVCNQNEFGLASDDKLIIGWSLEDEPDLAKSMVHAWNNDKNRVRQAWPDLDQSVIDSMSSWGPPIPPAHILEQYKVFKRKDPSRPVRLNLSMAVAYPEFKGRGTRSGHMEDYETYVKACDIISFDIYPYVDQDPGVKGKLFLQAVGINKLKELTKGEKPIWNYIETTAIFKGSRKPTKEVIRAEVWMSIIYGSRGIVYFCHGAHPETGEFWDKLLVSDDEQLENLRQINTELLSLAEVINSGEQKGAIMVRSQTTPSAELRKHSLPAIGASAFIHDGYLYVFAVRMEDTPAEGLMILRRSVDDSAEVEVIGENRTIKMERRAFKDNFDGYGVHLYKVKMN